MIRTPAFWYEEPGWQTSTLAPAAKVYSYFAKKHRDKITPQRASVPVVCIGNFVVGGAGKTPLTQILAPLLPDAHIISRGYGRAEKSSLLVDPHKHSFLDVGDEPLLLAQYAPTWVGPDRPTLAQKAAAAGAKVLLLDDGLQNPSLHKDLSLVVIDAYSGLGNEHTFPAGPLRESLEEGLSKAHALVLIGKDNHGLMKRFSPYLPVTMAHVMPRTQDIMALQNKTTIAFAGLARPQKFFNMLDREGIQVRKYLGFPDHHPYSDNDLKKLLKEAQHFHGQLVTTQKDFVRLPQRFKEHVQVVHMTLSTDKQFFKDLFHKAHIPCL
ncbi:MAG: tetraacyldisaccharide 4'-kinase [Alphaproteobacteria bacterium]|nr:tetraacyldisaccharide 4'-kinase [Alphaproteobacteria bacterium]